jgi:hypothetical protein
MWYSDMATATMLIVHLIAFLYAMFSLKLTSPLAGKKSGAR